jgi:O-antigen ligase
MTQLPMSFDPAIKLILIVLLVFTPLAFGSVAIWAFSLMELGILLIIVLHVLQVSFLRPWSSAPGSSSSVANSELRTPNSKLFDSAFRLPRSALVLCSLFLAFILWQMIPLPAEWVSGLSPQTYNLRTQLANDPLFNDLMIHYPMTGKSMAYSPSPIAHSPLPASHDLFPISFFPFATKIEFFKWATLMGLFFFLLRWKLLANGQRGMQHFILVIMLVGIIESFYGILEFFSGHRHILYLEGKALMSSVMGTFINRNYFAGYLLMVIPLSMGFLLARETGQNLYFRGWRHRLVSLDGKTILLGFGVILMILGLLFSASRTGIVSLLLSFTLVSFFFRGRDPGQKFSRTTVLIFSLALLWGAWIGLDAVISRFFAASEDFKIRWMFWANTAQILKDFPLFGSGLGTFAQIFPMYRSFHIRGLVTHAENDFLQLASETGFIGIGLLFFLFLFLFIKVFTGIRSLSYADPHRNMAIGGLIGILALMFHSLVERNMQVPANALLFTFLWALILKITHQSRRRPQLPNNLITQ